MTDRGPNFIARRVEDHKQKTQRLLQCHVCSVSTQFRGETEFLEHLKISNHSESAIDAPDGPIFRSVVRQAATKAKQQRNAKKLLDGPPGLSKQASDDSMKRNIGDSLSVSGPPRSPSAIAVKGPDPKIDEFKRLSLDHNNTPGVIPLKRRAGLQPPIESKIRSDTRNSPKSRCTRGSSGGGIGGGGGVDGNGRDIDFDRGKIHPSKKLYDPNTPNTHNSAIGKSVSSRTQVSPGSRKHGVRSKCDTDTRKGPPRQSHFQTPSRSSDNAGNLQQLQTILNYVEEPVDKNDWDDEEPELLLQPETRPISNDQLVQEVKGIYAGLVLVERKCMEIDEKQLSIAQDPDQTKRLPLTAEQWLALIALHKTLLHEHHDFFLASQHPSASEALMKLAEKYTMPARMWKHAIHAFLEVLRHHLPASYEFMLTFLNISYSMMALLLETVPMFEDIWVESLGDLSRYRMAIADNDQRDGDVWAGVARTWYGRAANKHPETGRLLHHLGILAKPYSISQLSFYCRSLAAIEPFPGAKASIMAMFRPVLAGRLSASINPTSLDTLLVKCLGFLFTGDLTQEYFRSYNTLINQGMFSKYCARAGSKLKENGVLICVSVLSGLLEFGATNPDGSSRSVILQEYEAMMSRKGSTKPVSPDPSIPGGIDSNERTSSTNQANHACRVAFLVFAAGLDQLDNRNIIPMIHAFTAFLNIATRSPKIMLLIEMEVPWTLLIAYLNHFTRPGTMTRTCLGPNFPKPADDQIGRPLPEDFLMRGQMIFFDYFPPTWFTDADIDEEEKLLQLPSMAAPRLSRILWNGICISNHNKWITYDKATFRFSITDYAKALEPRELPIISESGTLPTELEKMGQPALNFATATTTTTTAMTINTPSMSEKSDSMDFNYSGTPTSSRQVFTQPPKILKRGNKVETGPSAPVKATQVETMDTEEDMPDLSPPTA